MMGDDPQYYSFRFFFWRSGLAAGYGWQADRQAATARGWWTTGWLTSRGGEGSGSRPASGAALLTPRRPSH